MNLCEAIRSGKPFARREWHESPREKHRWFKAPDSSLYTLQLIPQDDLDNRLEVMVVDALVDDWYLQPDRPDADEIGRRKDFAHDVWLKAAFEVKPDLEKTEELVWAFLSGWAYANGEVPR